MGDNAGGWAGALAAVNTVDQVGRTPLYVACDNGYWYCAELCLQHGAQVDKADAFGSSPLLVAVRNGHSECVRLLLDAGASKEQEDAAGCTPMSEVRERCETPNAKGPHLMQLMLATSAEQRDAVQRSELLMAKRRRPLDGPLKLAGCFSVRRRSVPPRPT